MMGEYNYAIDTKGWLSFLTRFREQMGLVFVITCWTDHCLVAFLQQEMAGDLQKM